LYEQSKGWASDETPSREGNEISLENWHISTYIHSRSQTEIESPEKSPVRKKEENYSLMKKKVMAVVQ